MRGNRRYPSSSLVLLLLNPPTTGKLAQVLIPSSDRGWMNPDRFLDALQVIKAVGRVQRAFRAT